MSTTGVSTIAVTGASGLLGRAILSHLKSSSAWDRVVGTAFSRTGPDLVRVDLTDAESAAAFVREMKPAVLVHSAAQRFPDKVDKDFDAARRLNVESTEAIAKAMSEYVVCVLFIYLISIS